MTLTPRPPVRAREPTREAAPRAAWSRLRGGWGRLARAATMLLAFPWLAACSYLRAASEPMPKLVLRSLGPERARGVIVLLPGLGDRAETFQERGFAAALLAAAPDYDVIAADAHFGYYRAGSLVLRLEQDVMGPLRRQGYRELWLIGTSMGGHGAIGYARSHPEKIAGLMLFAPYMGPPDVLDEVRRAGGLRSYRAPAYQATPTGFARANFGWLRAVTCDSAHEPNGAKGPAIWLAVGDEDRLLPGARLLIDVLPPERVLIAPGGHGWKVWTPAARALTPRAFAR
jgi:pimeloyl-ACP methyl ester carboxylesterase